MKNTILLCLSLWAYSSFAQGKFEQASFKSKIQKVKKTKAIKTRKLRKERLGAGNKRKIRFAYGFGIYNNKMHQEVPLALSGENVIFRDNTIGIYQVTTVDGRFNNEINIKNQDITWVSDNLPNSYNYINEINTNREAIGFNMEIRAVKDDGLGSPTGYFFTSGVYYIDKSLPVLNYNHYELLFPLGIGAIIPGSDRFRVELSASSILGTNKSLGGKFDFSFVWKNIKFSPSFMYLLNNNEVNFNSGGFGLGVTYIPIKTKRYRRR